jgi:hypothetical protein
MNAATAKNIHCVLFISKPHFLTVPTFSNGEKRLTAVTITALNVNVTTAVPTLVPNVIQKQFLKLGPPLDDQRRRPSLVDGSELNF